MGLRWEGRKGRKKRNETKNGCLLKNRERRETYRKKSGEEKKKKRKEKKRGEWSQKLRLVGPSMCVYLQDCYHNSVSITWKHIKCAFSFNNSSLKNQKIEWWKQNLKTNPNKLSLCGSHYFWVIGDGNRVMGNKNTKTKQPLIIWVGYDIIRVI